MKLTMCRVVVVLNTYTKFLGKIVHLNTIKKGDEDYFSQKLHARIKENDNSPHGKFHRFLFPFSCKFSNLNFALYVLYIYLCYVTCHTKRAWVTYGKTYIQFQTHSN